MLWQSRATIIASAESAASPALFEERSNQFRLPSSEQLPNLQRDQPEDASPSHFKTTDVESKVQAIGSPLDASEDFLIVC